MIMKFDNVNRPRSTFIFDSILCFSSILSTRFIKVSKFICCKRRHMNLENITQYESVPKPSFESDIILCNHEPTNIEGIQIQNYLLNGKYL